MRSIIVDFIKKAKLASFAMNSRTLMMYYFNWKYRRDDPYGVSSASRRDTRYQDMIGLLVNRHFLKGLDVGCGEGVFSEMLLNVCDTVRGIDISDSAIQRAQRKYCEQINLQFNVGDVLAMNIDPVYDLIVCAEILYYLNYRQIRVVIAKITSALLPNGYLIVCNIKEINSDSGFFKESMPGSEINKLFEKEGQILQISEIDRGNDLITLFRKFK